MPSHSQFAINLDQQKAKAKKILKAIRQGDAQLLTRFTQHPAFPHDLTAENIKLADVQFLIARELGLPSWAKLKAHAEEMEQHRNAIKSNEPAPDADMLTLHVRCGHDIQKTLKQSGFQGEFLPMTDPLCIGPIPASDPRFIPIRASYVVETLFPIMQKAVKKDEIELAERNNVTTLLNAKFKRIVLWVEHDSYDQFFLLRALNLLTHDDDRRIEIIELNDFPGTERFIGIGQLPTEAIRACWKSRRTVTAKHLSDATLVWNALCSDTPESLVNLLETNTLDCFPNLANVIIRHLQELPHSTSGLSMTQRIGLSVLEREEAPVSFKAWFGHYQTREPLPFLGDIMFYALMLPLSKLENPLFIIDDANESYLNQRFTITPQGVSCLYGDLKVSPDYWVGGIFVNQNNHWCWSHQDLQTLRRTV